MKGFSRAEQCWVNCLYLIIVKVPDVKQRFSLVTSVLLQTHSALSLIVRHPQPGLSELSSDLSLLFPAVRKDDSSFYLPCEQTQMLDFLRAFFSSSPWGWRLVYEVTLINSSCFICSWGWVQVKVLETFTTTGTWMQPRDLKLFPFNRLFQTQSLSSLDTRWQIWILILRLSFLHMCICLIHVVYLICASMNKPLKHSVLKCLLKLL